MSKMPKNARPMPSTRLVALPADDVEAAVNALYEARGDRSTAQTELEYAEVMNPKAAIEAGAQILRDSPDVL